MKPLLRGIEETKAIQENNRISKEMRTTAKLESIKIWYEKKYSKCCKLNLKVVIYTT